MTINSFDRPTAQTLARVAAEAVREAFGRAGYGVEIKQPRTVYGDASMTVKLEFTAAGADPERKNFERYAPLYGAEASDYGRVLRNSEGEFKLIGLAPSRPKFPFTIERNGKRYKMTEAAVRDALTRADARDTLGASAAR